VRSTIDAIDARLTDDRDGPEDRALASELLELLREALEALPPAQRAVVIMRDVHGFPAEEVCGLLRLTPTNQRVLLHRGLSRVRAFLEDYVGDRSAARE
jgi:RNA polymerase sigma-70 factor (ECF subfamily)